MIRRRIPKYYKKIDRWNKFVSVTESIINIIEIIIGIIIKSVPALIVIAIIVGIIYALAIQDWQSIGDYYADCLAEIIDFYK